MELVKLNKEEQNLLESIKEREDEIVKILNNIAVLEFSINYNLGETGRLLDQNKVEENKDYLKLKAKLEEILEPLKNTEFKYKIMNFGALSISHSINEGDILRDCSQEVLGFRHNIQLPYTYVMGKRVGKKVAMEYIVNELKKEIK